jgi:hypothetical protein
VETTEEPVEFSTRQHRDPLPTIVAQMYDMLPTAGLMALQENTSERVEKQGKQVRYGTFFAGSGLCAHVVQCQVNRRHLSL